MFNFPIKKIGILPKNLIRSNFLLKNSIILIFFILYLLSSQKSEEKRSLKTIDFYLLTAVF